MRKEDIWSLEMTRRKFIEFTLWVGSIVIVMGLGTFRWLAEKASFKRFIRAVKMGRYPGKIIKFNGINRQGKWSG